MGQLGRSACPQKQLSSGWLTCYNVVGPTSLHGGVSRRGVSMISIVVICHARVRMLPLGHAENADQDKGVCDGIAACGPCAGGHCACSGLP